MKELQKLTEEEKAVLLHQLFPHEIKALLSYIKNTCITTIEREQQQRENWNKAALITYDFWITHVKQTKQIMDKYGKDLQSNSQLFARHLYVGYIAVFSVHCLIQYTTTRKHPNPKFTQAVDLLFL